MGLRAQNTAARARAKRPESQDEAVKNQMTARLADMDAKNALKVPEDSVKAAGEMMSPDFVRGFPNPYLIDTLENPTMVSVVASEHRLDLAACVDSRVPSPQLMRHNPFRLQTHWKKCSLTKWRQPIESR